VSVRHHPARAEKQSENSRDRLHETARKRDAINEKRNHEEGMPEERDVYD
jgi:hypothetical protein